MKTVKREYLKLLSEKYPSEATVSNEIINLSSILCMPKGTEHFISDLHGEYEAVRHILNNCSGVILEKVRVLFEKSLGDSGCHALCSLIYYPREELQFLKARGKLSFSFYAETISHLRDLAELMSRKYTRAYVRKMMSEGLVFTLDELLHMKEDEGENKQHYHEAIINSIIETGTAEDIIFSMTELIKGLAVDRLHVVGDIFDRGAQPEKIIELLMEYPKMDIQWGNHDILWLGAAAGSLACIASVLRVNISYDSTDFLERGYGISLRPFIAFCEKVYGAYDKIIAKKALSILGFKLEGAVIKRHSGFLMDNRLMLDKIDYENGTILINDKTYPLIHNNFPTINPKNPYALSKEEEDLMEILKQQFVESRELHRHMNFVFKRGSTYLCHNGNLIFHGCIPMTPEGDFASVSYDGVLYKGRALMDYADEIIKRAWAKGDESALDMMWYLWCGKQSPFSGRSFRTFERAMVEDKSTWEEPKNPYYGFLENQEVMGKILEEFGLDRKTGHIINGHTPVKAAKGESPVKAQGSVFVIDGGFCKAYQKTTGIAGYTLIYNSHGIRLKAHRPFNGVDHVLSENADIESDSFSVETFEKRRYIADTDNGEILRQRIEHLKDLLSAYREGRIGQALHY